MKKKPAHKKKSPTPNSASSPRPVGSIHSNSTGKRPLLGRKPNERTDPVAMLASQFKAIREKRGESIAKLAKALNIAPATLIKFEDRAHPVSLKILGALMEYMQLEIEVRQMKNSSRK